MGWLNLNKLFIGVDNGVTGAIGCVSEDTSFQYWCSTPIKTELSYTKEKKYISRVDFPKLIMLFKSLQDKTKNIKVFLERPLVNPRMLSTTMSAMRSLEATLIILEELKIPFSYLDSKQWQKDMLPIGLKGKELKEASRQIGKRLFPTLDFGKSDCDAILIAEYSRKNKL